MFPIHINLGFKVIYFYEGIYFAISVLIGYFWSNQRLKKYQVDVQHENLAFWVVLGIIIFGRLSHYVFWDIQSFLRNPLEIFMLWKGGVSVVGGIAGGVGAAFLYCYYKKVDFLKLFAVVIPVLLFAQGIGRIGCFLNGDAFGINTGVPWSVRFPKYGTMIPGFEKIKGITGYAWSWSYNNGLISSDSELSAYLHPTQLYEAFGDFLLVLIILLLMKLNDKSYRIILFVYISFYSILRFFIEYFRADRVNISAFGMSHLQYFLAACAMISISFIVHILLRRDYENK